jgi:hypothetical protein
MGHRAIGLQNACTINDMMPDDPPYIEEAAIGRPSYLSKIGHARPEALAAPRQRLGRGSRWHSRAIAALQRGSAHPSTPGAPPVAVIAPSAL